VKLDLADQEAIQVFNKRIHNRYEIRALINNVTCDWSMAHNKCISEIAQEDFGIRFRGAALITMGLLPYLKQLSISFIQHIIPFPLKREQYSEEMQHSISKMYAFAKELDEELKHTGISVSMVHPAPMRNMAPEFEMFDGLSEEISIMTPRMMAMKAVNGMLRGDRLIIPGFRNRVQYFLNRQATSWLRSAEESLGSTLQPTAQ